MTIPIVRPRPKKQKKISNPEAVGQSFDFKKFFQARELAHGLLSLCASKAQEGMTENQLQELLLKKAKEMGVERWWHPSKIRFAQNTSLSFKDKSLEGVSIRKGDTFFLDIGPVFDGHEADYGQTYRLGDPTFKNPAEMVFHQCKKIWKEKGLKGDELYQKAQSFAKEFDLSLNPKMAGHRLSDFPHALHHKGSLGSFHQSPSANLWILEIHLIGENEGFFFEDLL